MESVSRSADTLALKKWIAQEIKPLVEEMTEAVLACIPYKLVG